MKDIFLGHFRPDESEFKDLWSKCIFAVDANVLLNFYRYSQETRQELEKALNSIESRLFIPHQAAKEFLKNRLTVTISQVEEYSNAIKTIKDLIATLSNKKKHPFLPDSNLPNFYGELNKAIDLLTTQKDNLLQRLTNDEILDSISSLFNNKTGNAFSDSELKELVEDGEIRYQRETPPGYKDGKKDSTGDIYRKFGDLIIWKQIINKSKQESKPIIFISDDRKEDWWLEHLGRTISPRVELREEFIKETSNNFWMYTVDRFIEEAAKISQSSVSTKIIEEIKTVSEEARAEKIAREEPSYYPQYKIISKEELYERIQYSERWAENNEGFLGLVHFVKNYLGQAGFDWSASWNAVHDLEHEGLIEIYEHQGAEHERSIKAIRTKANPAFNKKPLEVMKNDLANHFKMHDGHIT